MLDTNLIIRCPWCGSTRTLKDWDDTTFSKCSTREMKRSFRSLTKEGTWLKNSNKYFVCRECQKWVKASQLIIESNDAKLKKLGRESVIMSAFSGGHKVNTNDIADVLPETIKGISDEKTNK